MRLGRLPGLDTLPAAAMTARGAARFGSDEELKSQDPQLPQSRWYLTDATHLGFRVIRPLTPNTPEEIKKYVMFPDTPKALEDRIKREGKN